MTVAVASKFKIFFRDARIYAINCMECTGECELNNKLQTVFFVFCRSLKLNYARGYIIRMYVTYMFNSKQKKLM